MSVLRSLLLLLILTTPLVGQDYLIHIPYEHRQRNTRASCVYASVANCMKIVGLKREAAQFWNMYKGDLNGENDRGISNKLERFGISHALVRDEESLINSLK